MWGCVTRAWVQRAGGDAEGRAQGRRRARARCWRACCGRPCTSASSWAPCGGARARWTKRSTRAPGTLPLMSHCYCAASSSPVVTPSPRSQVTQTALLLALMGFDGSCECPGKRRHFHPRSWDLLGSLAVALLGRRLCTACRLLPQVALRGWRLAADGVWDCTGGAPWVLHHMQLKTGAPCNRGGKHPA